MAGRNRHPMHGGPQGFREGPPPPMPRGPMHPFEEELAVREMDMRRLHSENRHLIDENVARSKDFARIKEELHAMGQAIPRIRADKEAGARELIQRGLKLEAELREIEPLKAEAEKLKSEAAKLHVQCREISANHQALKQDLKRLEEENQQVPVIKSDIKRLHEEVARARTAIQYEQKAHGELMDQRQAMENNLISMAREIEKLKAELRSVEKSSGGSGAVAAYGGLKAAADMGYMASFGDGYGSDAKAMYGSGAGAYDLRGFRS